MRDLTLYVPAGYHLLVEESLSWVPVRNMKWGVKCWSEHGFVELTIEAIASMDLPDSYANVDAVTTFAIDSAFIKGVDINYHWMPPWVSTSIQEQYKTETAVKGNDLCQTIHHAAHALQDFFKCRGTGPDCNILECKLPSKRLEKLKSLHIIPALDSHRCHSGRFTTVTIPKVACNHMCESCLTEKHREHALTYINTVLAVKGVVQDKGSHIEIKDHGLKLAAGAFRRLRRLMSMCAVPNKYISKVTRTRDGHKMSKNSPMKRKSLKRRLRLKLPLDHGVASCIDVKDGVRDKAEFHSIIKSRPTTTSQHAIIVPMQQIKERHSDKLAWYRIVMKTTNSIAIEGLMITLITK